MSFIGSGNHLAEGRKPKAEYIKEYQEWLGDILEEHSWTTISGNGIEIEKGLKLIKENLERISK